MNSDDTQPLLDPTNNIPLKVRKKKKVSHFTWLKFKSESVDPFQKLRPPPPPLRRKLPGGSVVQITAEEFDEHIEFGEIEVARFVFNLTKLFKPSNIHRTFQQRIRAYIKPCERRRFQ